MSWLFSRVLVGEYLGESCSDGEPSVQLNGSHTQLAYLSQDKMTAFSRLSRYGMTFKPLTESRGEELLTLYLAGFHAKTSQSQEKEMDLMESEAECGEKWQGSFAKWSQDSYSWKTHQYSLAGDLDEFSETFPQWGLMLRGVCWEQRMSGQTIREIGYGLLPTPCARDGRGSRSLEALKKANRGATNSLPDYFRILKNWQYPPVAAVEFMMGWQVGWTDLKPLETDKCHYARQQHGKS